MAKKLIELIANADNERLINKKTNKPLSNISPLGWPKSTTYLNAEDINKNISKAISESAPKKANAYILGLNTTSCLSYGGYYFTRSIYFFRIKQK